RIDIMMNRMSSVSVRSAYCALVFALGLAFLSALTARCEAIANSNETEMSVAKDTPGRLYKVGVQQRKFSPPGAYNWRGAQTHALITTIWYPADSGAQEQTQWIGPPEAPLFNAGKAIPEAKVAVSLERFPLIVLSHGTGGSAMIMGWLGSR